MWVRYISQGQCDDFLFYYETIFRGIFYLISSWRFTPLICLCIFQVNLNWGWSSAQTGKFPEQGANLTLLGSSVGVDCRNSWEIISAVYGFWRNTGTFFEGGWLICAAEFSHFHREVWRGPLSFSVCAIGWISWWFSDGHLHDDDRCCFCWWKLVGTPNELPYLGEIHYERPWRLPLDGCLLPIPSPSESFGGGI